jgi:Putative transposase
MAKTRADSAAVVTAASGSVDTSVRIEAHDRAGRERLLRYCARPAFSMERLRKAAQRTGIREARRHSGRADSYAAGADQPHCRPGASAAHPPPSLLRCAGTELAAQGGGDSNSAGRTFATGQGASRASHCGMRCANPERTCAAQELSSPLSVGGADRPFYRLSRPAYPQHAVRRCGRTVMRRRARPHKSSRTNRAGLGSGGTTGTGLRA